MVGCRRCLPISISWFPVAEEKIAFFEKNIVIKTMQEKLLMFRNRLSKVFRHLGKQALRQKISCWRLYDSDLPEFPFCIEIYEDKIYLSEYKRHFGLSDEAHEQWLEQCVAVITEVTAAADEKIYMRQRRRKPGRDSQYEKLDDEHAIFPVKEDGLTFMINLTDYLDTGLFLDHRITRKIVRQESKDKNVLNLFSYTGSFSVYAAAGGAASVTSVDLSKTYLQWGKENMQVNHLLDKTRHHFIHADVMQYLGQLPKDFFDLVIMDPPTFSNSKRMKEFLDIQRDHAGLINKTLSCMKTGAVLYFSTNFTRFVLDKEKIESPLVKDITRATTPFDFQRKLFRYCYRITK
jgi:23S rRNA (cytosine1962-C5)-methyltransferase